MSSKITPEDLRPETLDEIVGQTKAVTTLKGLIEQHRKGVPLPHLLFSGPPGVGKTTAAYALARAILGPSFRENFRELDTKNDRGLKMIQAELPWFSRMASEGAPFKMVFVDEADYLTESAQFALRRPLEENSGSTRVIFAANAPHKIIGALHSRAFPVPFVPLSDDQVRGLLQRVAVRLSLSPSPESVEAIVRHSKGQARDAVNLLIGGETGDVWRRFDDEVRRMFTPNGTERDQRIEDFIVFLRTEGFSDYQLVLYNVTEAVRNLNLPLPKGRDHMIREVATGADRCSRSSVELFQVEATLREVVG